MSNKTIRAVVVGVAYMPPEGDEARVSIRVLRKAKKGANTPYGSTFINVELELPPWICRNLVREVRNGMTKVKENKADALRSAETWLEEIRKAAIP